VAVGAPCQRREGQGELKPEDPEHPRAGTQSSRSDDARRPAQ
jgi:hypothetical protein